MCLEVRAVFPTWARLQSPVTRAAPRDQAAGHRGRVSLRRRPAPPRVPRCRVLQQAPRHQLPCTCQETPRRVSPALRGSTSPTKSELRKQTWKLPGLITPSATSRGTLPTAWPGPRRVLVCHRRHSCPCASSARERAWLSIGLPARGDSRPSQGPDACLSEHPCVCIRPCNLPPAGTDSSGCSEKESDITHPPHGRHSGVVRTLPPARGALQAWLPPPTPQPTRPRPALHTFPP